MSGLKSVRKLLQIISISLLTSIPMGSLAVTSWTATTGTVSAVYSHNGFHFIQTSIPDAPCGAAGKFWWPISENENAKDMFALALTAFVAGKRVNVAHDAAAPNCFEQWQPRDVHGDQRLSGRVLRPFVLRQCPFIRIALSCEKT